MTTLQLTSPHRFPERFLFFGGGGTGKTYAVLTIMRKLPSAHFWILDTDISYAYTRALATDFTEVEDRGNYTLFEIENWEETADAMNETVKRGDMGQDWLVVDSVTPTWQYVQSWYSGQVHGADLSDHMLRLRRETSSLKDFNKALTGDMTWPLINKLYTEKFYNLLHRWRGNFILTAEGAPTRSDDNEEEARLFGYLGVKPKGQSSLSHVAATTLYFSQPKVTQWALTTVKDRNRGLLDKEPWQDFAMDYLRKHGGWQVGVVK